MRALPIFAVAVALAGCVTQPPAQPTAQAQAELESLVAGRVAGPAVSCLPSYRGKDMVRIDEGTVAFREGGTVYVNRLQGECNGLNSGFYTLVTRSYGTGLCRGDIAHVTDMSTGMIVGSCAIGDFIPYRRS